MAGNQTYVGLDPVLVTHTGEYEPGSVREDISERFEARGSVGSGAMGEVHLVHDPELSRDVALKVMGGDSSKNRMLRFRFLTEAQVTAQLDHPNVVPIYGLERTESGAPAFSMKLVRGRTFTEYCDTAAAKLKKKQTLDAGERLPQRLEHFLRACDAISYAHARDVLHRDIKPDNVMVGAFGEVYVMDWGIAKVISSDANAEIDELTRMMAEAGQRVVQVEGTKVGTLLGTPVYMSPEQATDSRTVGPASDQFALGLVLFHLVCLKQPRVPDNIMNAVLQAREARLDSLVRCDGAAIPKDLVAIIRRACAERTDDRYASVEELAADVRRYVRGEMVLANPDGPISRVWRWTRAHPTLTMATFSGTVLLASAVTLGSLNFVLGVQSAAALEQARVTELVSAVSRRSHEIDNELIRTRSILESVAETTVALWDRGAAQDTQTLFDREGLKAGEAPADYGDDNRYKQNVTFTDVSFLYAPGVDKAAVEPDLRRIVSIDHHLRQGFLRSHDPQATKWGQKKQRKLLAVDGVSPAWGYVGLENGVLVNYPGLDKMPVDYDPRKRPWYASSRKSRGAHFGEPYEDASGFAILLPCSMALYDREDEFFGVAGLDFSLDAVVAMLELADVQGVTESWLVDSEGRIVVDSAHKGAEIEGGTQGNKSISAVDFPDPAPREAMKSGQDFGHFRTASGEVVFNRLNAVNWYYVVRLRG